MNAIARQKVAVLVYLQGRHGVLSLVDVQLHLQNIVFLPDVVGLPLDPAKLDSLSLTTVINMVVPRKFAGPTFGGGLLGS